MKCRECKWSGTVRMGNNLQTIDICRGNPPAVQLIPVQGVGGAGLQPVTLWPQIDPERDFCSHYLEDAARLLS